MSIKAGRVGVNPSQVDPVDGSIISSATSGYTKQEADAKFLTQTDAASTYESKSDASSAHNALQPKTLTVPIEMLSGTKLTVETALQGLSEVSISSLTTEEGYTYTKNVLRRQGNIVFLNLVMSTVTGVAEDLIGTIPQGYIPSEEIYGTARKTGGVSTPVKIQSDGKVKLAATVNGESISLGATWLIG